MMKNILLFAGTTEGRLLAEFLIHQPVRLHTAVATAYGASLLPSAPSMTVSSHRMNEAQMIDFIQQQHFDLVLDATHPYASEASANIRRMYQDSSALPANSPGLPNIRRHFLQSYPSV